MKILKVILPIALLMAVSLSCKLLNRGGDAEVTRFASNLPTYDRNAVQPSAGAVALRRLAELEPNAANLEREVEASERAALNKLLAEFGVHGNNGTGVEQTTTAHFAKAWVVPVDAASSVSKPARSSLLWLQGKNEPAADSAHDAALIGGLVAGLSDIFSEVSEKGSGNKTTTETKDAVTSTVSAELRPGGDGSKNFTFAVKSQGTKNGVAVKSDVNAKIDGQRCPNSQGQVSFSIKVTIAAQLGETSYTQELTANVQAVVNDDAQLASHTIEVVQSTKQLKAGQQTQVETGQTFTNDGSNYTRSNNREIRASTDSDKKLANDAVMAAFGVGRSALAVAETNWYRGGCTKIEAKSPGMVQPGSTTSIPVTVRHRFEGTEIPCKLAAELQGERSVDPTTLPKTPGTLTYTAPGEANQKATISLTATSRRGRATLDLTATTGSTGGGQGYRVKGQSNGVSFSGEICSLGRPFSIDATFPGGTAKTSFTPSGDTNGRTTVSGGGNGCTHTGGGTYSVTLKADGSASITWTTADTIACPGFSNSRTATFTLPLQPAPDLACR